MIASPIPESVRPTFDSRDAGPHYWVTATLDDRPVVFRRSTDDPFVRQTVRVGWRDLLRGLLRRSLTVEVTVGGAVERMNDVLELDANSLIKGRTREIEFRHGLHVALSAHPEARCHECGGRNVTWSAPNDLWNEVMGGPDGIVCPACFTARAETAGRPVIFRAIAGRAS